MEEGANALKNAGSRLFFGYAAKDISLALSAIAESGVEATAADWKMALQAAEKGYPGARRAVNAVRAAVIEELNHGTVDTNVARVAVIMRDQGFKDVAEALRDFTARNPTAKDTFNIQDVIVIKKTNWKKPVAIVTGVALGSLAAGSLLAEIIGKPVDLSKVGPLP